MAQGQLESVLDVLKLLPLSLLRSSQLMNDLDTRIQSQHRKIDKLYTNVESEFQTETLKEFVTQHDVSETLNDLQQIRQAQHDSYIYSGEKLAIAREMRDNIVAYIQRIEEDMEFIANEQPQVLENGENGSTGNNFLDDFAGGGRGGGGTASKSQRMTAAQKGIKAPRVEIADATEQAPTQPTHQQSTGRGIRRKSAAYGLMDTLSDQSSDDEYVEPGHHASNQRLAATGYNSNMASVDMDDLPMMSTQMNYNNNAGAGHHNNSHSHAHAQAQQVVVEQDDSMNEEGGADNQLYCTCRQPSFGEMIGCDDPQCTIEWFHFGCVGLKKQPKGTWICPLCSARRAAERG